MSGIHADLHGDSPVNDQYDLMHGKIKNQDLDGFKASVLFDFPSTLVPVGRIAIAAAGRWFEGDVEAEHSCMLTMIEAVHTQFNLFPADFSYMAISEKRALFNAMMNAIEPCRADFVQMSIMMKECYTQLSMLCDLVSVWIGDHHPLVDIPDIRAVVEFQTCMSKQAKRLYDDVQHAGRLSDIIVLRNVAPERQARLDAGVPMPMVSIFISPVHTLSHSFV